MSDTSSFGTNLTASLAASEEKKRALCAKTGRLSSRARFESLFDEGSYTELAAFCGGADAGDADRLICAFGAVSGECVYAFSQEFSQDTAAFTLAGAKKLRALYELAEKRPAPIIGFFDANGAKITEGLSLAAELANLCALRSDYRALAPQIALIAGPCGASLAAFAAGFDLVLMNQQNGELFLNPPSVINTDSGEKDAAKAPFCLKHGLCALACDGEAALIASAKQVLSYLPERCDDSLPVRDSSDNPMRPLPAFDASPDADKLLGEVFDQNSRLELFSSFGKNTLSGFATLGGIPCVYAASNGGLLTRCDVRKLINAALFADRFELPLITFVNADGFSAECEGHRGIAELCAALSDAYATSDIPMLTVYHGNAYGPILSLCGAKALGADFAFALPFAKLSLLKPDAAVAFSENEKLRGSENPIAGRAALVTQYLDNQASPVHAAHAGLLDDILDPAELRSRLCFSLNMLTGV